MIREFCYDCIGSSISLQSLVYFLGISISKDDTDFSKKEFRTLATSLSSNIILPLSILVNVLFKVLLLVKKRLHCFPKLFVISDIFRIKIGIKHFPFPFIKTITEVSLFFKGIIFVNRFVLMIFII